MTNRAVIPIALAMATIATVPGNATEEYLEPDLRAQVEQLKADVHASPTDVENARARATILWHWVNAYAMDERYVPVNLTQDISSLLAYPLALRGRGRYRTIDGYVRELGLLDEDPDALGQIQATVGPFEAATWDTIEQTITIGSRSIAPTGGFLIARHMMAGTSYQASDPGADGYVSIRSSNDSVTFRVDSFPIGGMHGGFRRAVTSIVFRVASGTLKTGDTVTVTYGDTSGGGRGIYIPDVSIDFLPFPIYVDLDGSNHFLSLPIQPISVHGTTVAGVHAFAPSIVAVGEPFDISVRAQDRFYNRATGPLPEWWVYVGDERVATIEAGTQAITVLSDLSVDTPGVYRITVRSKDGSIRGDGNPILAEHEPSRRIYWGDTHGHSGFAEGIGSPDRLMIWARDDARLDYVSHSEHDIWMDDYEWEVLKDNVLKYTTEDFIAFLGYEWTVQNIQGGHHNVLFRTTADRVRVPAQTHGNLRKLYQGLHEHHNPSDVIVIPHAHQPGDYRLNDPTLEPLVEIMSQHGTFEWYGRMYLRHGHQVGFTAASDNHMAQPGYTAPRGGSLSQRGGLGAIIALQKTRDDLFDAMKDLATYAATGDRMILDFEVNGATMGQRIAFAEERRIRGRVVGTAPIDEVVLVRNGEPIETIRYLDINSDANAMDGTYDIVFYSDSHPYHPNDNPRGWRAWRGSLRVENATIADAAGFDFSNPDVQALRHVDQNTVEFATQTRGDTSTIRLQLTEVQPGATVVLELAAAREYGGGPPKMRRHQPTPASTVRLDVFQTVSGRDSVDVPSTGYVDRVDLRRVRTEGEIDVAFEMVDSNDKQGDYYYIRVKQVNDSLAWSSPVWVGGFPKP